jgi:molybdate transport system substrate-binding protein
MAKLELLSAGAVKPGVANVIGTFQQKSGHMVNVTFATAPEIRKRMSGTTPHVVIAPPQLLDDLVKAGKVTGERVIVGQVGVGVMVREGTPLPKIATVDELRQSLLDADSVVYNHASTGIYLETLFARLGIAAQLKTKTTRYPDAAAVLDHVNKGRSKEIGFGATTVIVEGKSKGLIFVGPLPAEIQNYTTYAAMATPEGAATNAAHEFLGYLSTDVAKAILAEAGIQT